MGRFFGFILLIVSATSQLRAQNPVVDSLKAELEKPGLHDTTRLELINGILSEVQTTDSIGLHYNTVVRDILFRNLAKKGLSKKERNAFRYYLAYWYADKAFEIYSVKNGWQVISYYDKAIKLLHGTGHDEEAWQLLANKGIILRKMGFHQQAIACYFEALKQQEAAGDKNSVLTTYSGLAVTYEGQKNFPMALRYYGLALDGYNRLKDLGPQTLYEKAILLHNMGFVYSKSGNDPLARTYYERALEIDYANGFSDQASFNNEKIGNTWMHAGDYDKAMFYFRKALGESRKDRSRSTILFSIGDLYFKQQKWQLAKSSYLEALQLAEGIADHDLEEMATLALYDTYRKLNDPAHALDMYERYIRKRDEVDEEAAKNSLAQQQLKYEYEKRALLAKAAADRKLAASRLAHEKAAARQNMLIYGLLAVAIILGGIVWFLYYYFRQKAVRNEHRNNELKQKLLLSQMNPHFIFNSVDNIQSLIHAGKRDEAVSYLTKFSRLTRQILEHSRENYILLSEEVATLENYLSIQRLLYNSVFEFTVSVDDAIDPELILVPPMLTQPFVENAIRHGLSEKSGNGKLCVRYTIRNEQLHFAVTDNGTGLKSHTSGHKSLSTLITRERLEIISPENTPDIATSEIRENGIVAGVRTEFTIPFIYNN